MKISKLFLISVFSIISFALRSEIVVLNAGMTEADALVTPYVLDKSINPETHSLTLDFQLNAIEFVLSDETTNSYICLIPGNIPLNEEGRPQIPFFNLSYNIPSQEKCSITINDIEYQVINRQIAKAEAPYAGEELFSSVGETMSVEESMDTDAYFPQYVFEPGSIHDYKGIDIHYFNFAPVSYNDKERKLNIITKCKIEITYTPGIEDKESERNLIFKAYREQNLNSVCEILDWDSKYNFFRYPHERTEDYLIIANIYTDGLEDFVEWKRKLGYRVHVVKEIPNAPGRYSWKWDEIKDVIEQYYKDLPNLNYVLLWGHANNIPGMPLSQFDVNQFMNNFRHDENYCDKQFTYTGYALSDGSNVNPRFHVGRIHSHNTAENYNIIEKILNYEQHPVTDSKFYKNAFLVSQFDPYGYHNSPEDIKAVKDFKMEDLGFVQWMERTRPILVSNGINAKRIYKRQEWMELKDAYPERWTRDFQYNIKHDNTLFPTPYEDSIPYYLRQDKQLWNSTKKDIQESLSDGAFLGMYYGHGNCFGWCNFLEFSEKDFLDAHCGNKTPLIFSMACTTGQAFWNGSFANRLSGAKEGPIGIIASSDVSFVTANQYTLYGMTNALFPTFAPGDNKSFFADYPSDFRLGEIMYRGIQFYQSVANDRKEIELHQLLTYTCFGDPSTDIYTDVPQEFQDPEIVCFGGDIYVNPGTNDQQSEYPLYINFYERTTGRVESYKYEGYEIHYESTAEDNIPVSISLTSHNKIPYVTNINAFDGESTLPTRSKAKFINIRFDETNSEIEVEFELNPNIPGHSLSYVALDDKLESIEVAGKTELDLYSNVFRFPIPYGFKGYVQLTLNFYDQVVDSMKVRIN